MSECKAVLITWDHAIPHLSKKSLSMPYEGLVDGDSFTRDDLSKEDQDWIEQQIDRWFANLPVELDRIAKAASDTLARKASKFEHAEAERVLYLIEKLRGIKSAHRSRDVLYGYLLGRRVERMGTLPFEPLVVGRQKQLGALDKHNEKKRKASTKRKQEALEAIEQTKLQYPNRAGDIDFIKEQAAESIGIKKRALNERLSK